MPVRAVHTRMADYTGECLGCGEEIDLSTDCPHCGWSREEWAGRGRYGLDRPGTGSWDEED